MKVEEMRKMRKGTKVWWRTRRGEIIRGKFVGATEVISHGRMTLEELISGEWSLEEGKKEWEAAVDYIDDNGRTKQAYIGSRRLHR